MNHPAAHTMNINECEHKYGCLTLEKNSALLLKVGVGLQMTLSGLAHHGVLAHEHHGTPTKGHADLLHLLGAHIVSAHDEATAVLVKQLSDLSEVVSLPSWLVHPNHLEPWIKAPLHRT